MFLSKLYYVQCAEAKLRLSLSIKNFLKIKPNDFKNFRGVRSALEVIFSSFLFPTKSQVPGFNASHGVKKIRTPYVMPLGLKRRPKKLDF